MRVPRNASHGYRQKLKRARRYVLEQHYAGKCKCRFSSHNEDIVSCTETAVMSSAIRLHRARAFEYSCRRIRTELGAYGLGKELCFSHTGPHRDSRIQKNLVDQWFFLWMIYYNAGRQRYGASSHVQILAIYETLFTIYWHIRIGEFPDALISV